MPRTAGYSAYWAIGFSVIPAISMAKPGSGQGDEDRDPAKDAVGRDRLLAHHLQELHKERDREEERDREVCANLRLLFTVVGGEHAPPVCEPGLVQR